MRQAEWEMGGSHYRWYFGNMAIQWFVFFPCYILQSLGYDGKIWWKDIGSVEVDEPWWSTLERQASSLYCLALAGTSCHKRKWGLTRIVQSTSHLSGEACWIILAGRNHGFCCLSLFDVVGYYIILIHIITLYNIFGNDSTLHIINHNHIPIPPKKHEPIHNMTIFSWVDWYPMGQSAMYSFEWTNLLDRPEMLVPSESPSSTLPERRR